MMLDIKTFVPLYYQLKLHMEAQIGSGVRRLDDQFPQVESSYHDDDAILWAELCIKKILWRQERYDALRFCS
jgi:hypothetical protein